MAEEKERCFKTKSVLIGSYFMFLSILILLFVMISWSANGLIFLSQEMSDEQIILWKVFLAGALGSHIHAVMSFSKRMGNRSIDLSWSWWYILKPWVGGFMGIILYFVIRGGILSAGTSPDSINIYGVTGIAGMAGLFSEQATQKLKEVFAALFKVDEEIKKDKEKTTRRFMTSYVRKNRKVR